MYNLSDLPRLVELAQAGHTDAQKALSEYRYLERVRTTAMKRMTDEKVGQIKSIENTIAEKENEVFESNVNDTIAEIRYVDKLAELDSLRQQHIEATRTLDNRLVSELASKVFQCQEELKNMRESALKHNTLPDIDVMALKQEYTQLALVQNRDNKRRMIDIENVLRGVK